MRRRIQDQQPLNLPFFVKAAGLGFFAAVCGHLARTGGDKADQTRFRVLCNTPNGLTKSHVRTVDNDLIKYVKFDNDKDCLVQILVEGKNPFKVGVLNKEIATIEERGHRVNMIQDGPEIPRSTEGKPFQNGQLINVEYLKENGYGVYGQYFSKFRIDRQDVPCFKEWSQRKNSLDVAKCIATTKVEGCITLQAEVYTDGRVTDTFVCKTKENKENKEKRLNEKSTLVNHNYTGGRSL